MDDTTKNILANKSLAGGILAFNAIRFSMSVNNNVNALRIVDKETSTHQIGSGGTLAYWAPQGGYVDIPAHPKNGKPELVFTPDSVGVLL